MTKKKTYFITVDTEEIREVSIPDNSAEYEVNATFDEIKDVEMLLANKEKNARDAVKHLGKPFNEKGADTERSRYDVRLIKLFRKLYELGTIETKDKINSLSLF